MNGEVIWMAYEELGLDAGACATAMDAELALRRRTLDIMATLERSPGPAVCRNCRMPPALPVPPARIWPTCMSMPRHHSGSSGCPRMPSAAGSMPACCRTRRPGRQASAPQRAPIPPGAGCSARVLRPKRSPRQRILTLSRKKACLLGKAWVKELLARPCWMHGSLPAQCAAAVTRLCRIYDTHSFLHIRRTS